LLELRTVLSRHPLDLTVLDQPLGALHVERALVVDDSRRQAGWRRGRRLVAPVARSQRLMRRLLFLMRHRVLLKALTRLRG
jgi:hypothetical protein